jgi:hypothetical protein
MLILDIRWTNLSRTMLQEATTVISLTYLSTAVEAFDEAKLLDLLRTAREKNHGAGLTGMLLYVGGHFIQTLEGSEDAVDATFARIGQDPRHRDVFMTLRESTEARTFPDWSMGFETLSAEEATLLPGFNDYLDTKAMSPDSGESLGRAGVFHRVFRDRMR